MAKARSWIIFVGLGTLAGGCAHGNTPLVARVPPGEIAEDPTSRLIAGADAHLAAGVAQSRAGHLNRAREEFDRSLDVYLNAPGGAFANARLAEGYRRTLEAIQLHEFEALAAGDGFTETLPEPAAIDEVADLPVGGVPASEETRRTAEDALRGETNDLTITLNDAVLAAIDLYQGPLRDWFAAALARGGRYLPRIRQVFASEGIPQDLAYVALVESAYKTGALSRAKARGVWQFIPETGKRFGLKQDWWVDERSSPEKSTRAAAQYLKELYGMFKDWNLALAAYNAGERKVARGLDQLGEVDFWEMAQSRHLARETKNYVPMIHAAIVVAKAPDKYGFMVEAEPLLTFDSVPVNGAMDLRLIAECSGAAVQQIQLLNPELRRLATPAERTYHIKVPTGSGTATAACLDNIPPEKRVAFRTHTVARGQTLAMLSKRYGSTPRAIADANGLRPGRSLAKGAELIIPIDPSAADRLSASSSATRVAQAQVPARPVRISYRVKRGDTLSAIASRYKTTVGKLKAWNRLTGARLAVGQPLTLFTRKAD